MPSISAIVKDFQAPDDTVVFYSQIAVCYFTEGEASDYSATIFWGDGKQSTGIVGAGGGTPPGGFDSLHVDGEHDYDEIKAYDVRVVISGPEGVVAQGSDIPYDLPVNIVEGQYLRIIEGDPFDEFGNNAALKVQVYDGDNTPVDNFTKTIQVAYTATDYGLSTQPAIIGQDFSAISDVLTFPPGTSERFTSVPINDLRYDEWLYEEFQIYLSDPVQADFTAYDPDNYPINAHVSIEDDEEPLIGFTKPLFTGREGGGSVSFDVKAKYISEIDLTVSYKTIPAYIHNLGPYASDGDGTYVYEDYEGEADTFTFGAGAISLLRAFDVTIFDNADPYDDDFEYFAAELLEQSLERKYAQPWIITEPEYNIADAVILDSSEDWDSLFDVDLELINPRFDETGTLEPCDCGCGCFQDPADIDAGNHPGVEPITEGVAFHGGDGRFDFMVPLDACALDGWSCGRYQTYSVGSPILFDNLDLFYSTETLDYEPLLSARLTLLSGSYIPKAAKITASFDGNSGSEGEYGMPELEEDGSIALSRRAPDVITESGIYEWSFDVSALFDDEGEGVDFALLDQKKAVVRFSSSRFGIGWNLASLDQVFYDEVNGLLLYATGDGVGYIFIELGGGTFESPDDLFGTLVQNVDDTFTYTTFDGIVKNFRTDGQLSTVSDRHNLTITYAYDKFDQLINILDPDDRITTFTYEDGYVRTILQAGNRVTTLNYSAGELTSIELPDGGTREFTYDEAHFMTSESWGTRTTTFAYADGMLSEIDQGLGTVTKIRTAVYPGVAREMDGTRPVAVITDPLNQSTTISMDDYGHRLRMQTPDGAEHRWTVDAAGLMLTYRDPLNRTTSYTYLTDTNLVTKIQHPDTSYEQFHYDGTKFYQLDEYTDTLNHRTTMTLNGTGDVVTIKDALNNVTTFTWDGSLVKARTDALKHTTTYTYDANRRLETITDAEGGVTTLHYDAAWNLDRYTDPLNRTTTYVYDGMRRLQSVTTPDIATVTYDYADPGWQTKVTDQLGTDTEYEYDVRGWLQSMTEDAGGSLERTTTYVYDVAARLIRITDPLGQHWQHRYDPMGRPIETTDAMGYVTTQTYDLAGNNLTVTDALNNTTTFTYHSQRDWLTVVEDALNHLTTMTYDSEGNLLTLTNPDVQKTTYTYDNLNRLTKIEQPLSATTQYAFDGVGNLLSVTDRFGTVTSYAYNKRDQVTKVIEAHGTMAYERDTEFEYDKAGQLLYSTDPYGTITSFAYDGAGRVTRIIEAVGTGLQRTTSFGYDLVGRQTKITDPLNTVTSFGYDALHRLIKVTEAYGLTSPMLERSTTMAYDALDRMIGSTDPIGTQVDIGYDGLGRPIYQATGVTNDPFTTPAAAAYSNYDALGRLILVSGPGNVVTSMSYDKLGQLTKLTEAWDSSVERTSEFQYDKMGRLYNAIDPLGTVTSYAYDALSRATKITEAFGVGGVERSTQFTYGTSVNTIKVTNPRGDFGTLSYDPLGRLSSQSDGLGHSTTFKYDALDRLTQQTDALGRIVTYTYDALSRNTRIDQPESVFATFAYDTLDRLTQHTDALNNVTSFAYDALSRQVRMTDGRGYHTTMEYDAMDRLTKLIDPNGNQTTYGYDGVGRQIRRTDASLNISTYAYDSRSRLISMTDRAATRRDFRYDELDRRVLERRFAVNGDLVESLTFSYDLNGNITGAANSSGTYTIAYNQLNQTKVVQEPFNLTLTFSYDAAGNRTLVEDSKSGLVSSSYDAANRLTRREMYTSSTLRLAMDYAYNDADQVLSETRRNGSNTQIGRTTYAYDNAGRTKLLKHQNGSNTDFQTLTYTYDAANRVTALIRNSTTTSYQYDAADQLTKDGAINYGYDKAGNPDDFEIGTGNRLLSTSNQEFIDAYVYEYDDKGNRVERSYVSSSELTVNYSQKYSYDHANRLVSYLSTPDNEEFPTVQVEYILDAFGNRIGRLQLSTLDESTTTTSYAKYGIDMWEVQQDFWGNRLNPIGNEAANVWVDLNGMSSDALTMRRMYGPGWDNVEARLDNSNTARWYLNDRFGSVIGAVDGSGAPVATITYQAFGTKSSGTLIDRYSFQGREYDDVIGTYYMRDRIYDSEVRRFLQEDPLERFSGDYNWYRFVGNNPTNSTDPSGMTGLLGDEPTWHHLIIKKYLVNKKVYREQWNVLLTAFDGDENALAEFIHSKENGWILTREDHTKLQENRTLTCKDKTKHETNWEKDWDEFLNGKKKLTREELDQFVSDMKTKYGLSNSKGKPFGFKATQSYSDHLSDPSGRPKIPDEERVRSRDQWKKRIGLATLLVFVGATNEVAGAAKFFANKPVDKFMERHEELSCELRQIKAIKDNTERAAAMAFWYVNVKTFLVEMGVNETMANMHLGKNLNQDVMDKYFP